MAFQKRKTSYRKGVTSTVLDEYPIPEEGEQIARIVVGRGGNVFEVELPEGGKALALLPTKYNKLIWMKRGDYVIISGSDGSFTTSSGKQNGVDAMIQHILMKEQVNHIKKEGKWPKEWCETHVYDKSAVGEEEIEESCSDEESDLELEGNPNRRRFYVEKEEESE